MLLDMMKAGGYFYKHDFGRNKRSRKELKLSSDGLKLTWRSVGESEGKGASGGSPSSRGILRSASFSRGSSSASLARACRQLSGSSLPCEASLPFSRRSCPGLAKFPALSVGGCH